MQQQGRDCKRQRREQGRAGRIQMQAEEQKCGGEQDHAQRNVIERAREQIAAAVAPLFEIPEQLFFCQHPCTPPFQPALSIAAARVNYTDFIL